MFGIWNEIAFWNFYVDYKKSLNNKYKNFWNKYSIFHSFAHLNIKTAALKPIKTYNDSQYYFRKCFLGEIQQMSCT